ncbi:MAG TPA: response regulator [Cyclobacteriaceae bacterium]
MKTKSNSTKQYFRIQVEQTTYVVNGDWHQQAAGVPELQVDSKNPLQFNCQVIADKACLIHPGDIANVKQLMLSAELQQVIKCRFRIITSGLEVHWFEGTGVLEIIGGTGSKQVPVVFDDITERRQMEEKDAFLLKLSDALRPIADPVGIMDTASELLGKHLDTERVGYGEVKATGNGEINATKTFLTVARDWTSGIKESVGGGHGFSDFGEEMNAALLRGDVFVLEDALETFDDPEALKDYEETSAPRSALAVPLLKKGKVVAGIYVQQSTPRKWPGTDVQLVREVVERTWEAVERAKVEKALAKSEQHQTFVLKFNDALRRLNDAAEIQQTASRFIAEHLGVDRVLYAEIEGSGAGAEAVLRGQFVQNGAPMLPERISYAAVSQGLVAEAFRKGVPFVVNDAQTDPRFDGDDDVRAAWLGIGGRSVISLSLVKDGVEKIIFGVHYSKPRDWTQAEIDLMGDVAERTWAAAERARAENALRENEDQLRKLNARLQETDKAKTNFFSNVSHEFRTPLTLLIGPLEELIKSGKTKMIAEDMQKLQFAYRSAVRLQKLVTALLDFSRIEAGKLEAFYQPADFSQITTELAGNFRSAIEKGGLKYVVKTEHISEPIYLNREIWEKIVFNLLSNAFKFTQKGKIEVIIRETNKNAELKVKDTGAGIATKNIDRIFDRFTRIEGTIARTQEGTGIGLALVRELVSAQGGSVKVKSVEGVGSEFIVSIPKGKAHFAKHQVLEGRERKLGQDLKDSFVEETLGWLPEDVKATRRNLKQYQKEGVSRVLVVEDNADMRDYLSTVLSEDDHKIVAFEDGQKVIKFLQEGGQADLILADVMMPLMDGFELVKKLKSNPEFAAIPVILLTAKATGKAKIEGLRIGADAYLTKPFSARELRTVVLSSIERANKPV